MTSEVKMPVAAYLTNDEEGSPAMLFFDPQEAAKYTDETDPPQALVLQSDALAAIEAARVEALDQAYDAMFEVAFKKGRVDKATLFDAQTAIRKLKESGSLAKEAP